MSNDFGTKEKSSTDLQQRCRYSVVHHADDQTSRKRLLYYVATTAEFMTPVGRETAKARKITIRMGFQFYIESELFTLRSMALWDWTRMNSAMYVQPAPLHNESLKLASSDGHPQTCTVHWSARK